MVSGSEIWTQLSWVVLARDFSSGCSSDVGQGYFHLKAWLGLAEPGRRSSGFPRIPHAAAELMLAWQEGLCASGWPLPGCTSALKLAAFPQSEQFKRKRGRQNNGFYDLALGVIHCHFRYVLLTRKNITKDIPHSTE